MSAVEIPRWAVDASTIVAAIATILLAIATLVLALATRKLAHTAAEESQHIAQEAGATAQLAETSAEELDELKKQNTNRPLLLWEQRADAYGHGVEAEWEPGAETVAPKTGKRVTFSLMLRAENLGGAARMGDANIRAGDGRITFESPRKLVPPTREYLIRVAFDAIGGKPFRDFALVDQRFTSWNTGEAFTTHVLIALASDWYDTNDPSPMVIELDREDRLDDDAKFWIEQHFSGYNKWRNQQRAEAQNQESSP